MTDAVLIGTLTPLETLALTVYGEARGERIEGKVAVACTVRNRVKSERWGKDYKRVCLAPWQFSCWREEGGPTNYGTVILGARDVKRGSPTPILKECLWTAEGVLIGHLLDITRGATHYMTRELWESKPPKWAIGRTPLIGIGAHVFFGGVD